MTTRMKETPGRPRLHAAVERQRDEEAERELEDDAGDDEEQRASRGCPAGRGWPPTPGSSRVCTRYSGLSSVASVKL